MDIYIHIIILRVSFRLTQILRCVRRCVVWTSSRRFCRWCRTIRWWVPPADASWEIIIHPIHTIPITVAIAITVTISIMINIVMVTAIVSVIVVVVLVLRAVWQSLTRLIVQENRVSLRLLLLKVFGAMCSLDPALISTLLNSVLTMELARDLQTHTHGQSHTHTRSYSYSNDVSLMWCVCCVCGVCRAWEDVLQCTADGHGVLHGRADPAPPLW